MIKSRISFGAFNFVYLYVLESSESRLCLDGILDMLGQNQTKGRIVFFKNGMILSCVVKFFLFYFRKTVFW